MSPAAAACPCAKCDCLNSSICRDGNCDGNYVVAVSAKWCGPCHGMIPVYEELRSRGFSVYVLDFDVHKRAIERIQPRVFPTIIVYNGGREVERVLGTTTVEYLEARLE